MTANFSNIRGLERSKVWSAMPSKEKENKPLDPRVFKDNRIDPMQIHGFAEYVSGNAEVIRDHPEFPNPRSLHNMDMGVVEDISKTGSLLEPVKLYWASDGSVVLADGKTRMTGLGMYLRNNPNQIGKIEIPLQRVKGTDNEVRLLMLQWNFKDSRRPLTEADVSKYLRDLDAKGVTQDEQLKVLDKSGRRGLIWLNHMKQILDANPAVVQAYEKGEIEFTTAKMLAKSEFKDQPQKLEAVRELKRSNPDKNEAEIRKLAGVKKANRVTMGFEPTFNYLVEKILIPDEQYLEVSKEQLKKHKEIQREVDKHLKEIGVYEEYQDMLKGQQIRDLFAHFMFFMRMEGAERAQQIQFMLDNMDDEQRQALEAARAARQTQAKARSKGGLYAG